MATAPPVFESSIQKEILWVNGSIYGSKIVKNTDKSYKKAYVRINIKGWIILSVVGF
jgi:hypothetical protein